MNYTGINYAGPQSTANLDAAAGIRYGVISQNDVGQAWFDGAEADYGKPHCPKCGNESQAVRGEYARYQHAQHECDDHVCHNCRYVFGNESAFPESPLGFYVDDDGVKATAGEDGDIFVIKSPFYTYAQFCSPCAPGACHLANPLDRPVPENKCYCFGHDWFESGLAPYPVYRVEDDQRVAAERQTAPCGREAVEVLQP